MPELETSRVSELFSQNILLEVITTMFKYVLPENNYKHAQSIMAESVILISDHCVPIYTTSSAGWSYIAHWGNHLIENAGKKSNLKK